jgi:bifunctional non-homologous end joining protein LigD
MNVTTAARRCRGRFANRTRRCDSSSHWTIRAWERACAEGWEGVIARRRDSPSQPPLAALAEDEVRSVAGLHRRRLHGSAGRARRARRAPRRPLRAARLRLRRKSRHRLRHGAAPGSPRVSGRARDPEAAVHQSVGLPRLRAHWVHPEIVVHVAFIEWTVHGKLRHSRLLGVRFGVPQWPSCPS